jgi:arabinogalactan endo-1,4-beta-galactosidase
MTTQPPITRRQFAKRLAAAALLTTLDWPSLSSASESSPRTKPFILGADVSWIPQDEAAGATYWDRGIREDPLQILKSYNFNFIRARIFVNPGAPGGYAARLPEAFCDLDQTKKWARRIRDAGLGFLLSFHYSDTWTSPAHQAKPAAWAHLPFNKLVDAVHDWTFKVVSELKSAGTPPDMVSIGNETSDGMLFPDGRAANFDNFAQLANAGCLAVREIDPKIPIALHNHLGRDNAAVVSWVDNFLARKTQFDIIGLSCYNEAHPNDWQSNFNDLAVRYPNLSFLAMECSYQKRYLNDLIFNAPSAKGLGSFIWEPTRWREAVFDHNGMNAGADMNNRPHLPASTLPPLGSPNQPIYKPAKPPAYVNNDADLNVPTTRPRIAPATRPDFRPRIAGRYDTNSYILAYPEMAKAYGLA